MSDESSEEEQNNRRKNYPRFIKNSLEDIDLETIWMNTSCCQYPVLEDVAKVLRWEIDDSDESESWDVFWTDSAIDSQQLFKMHHFQKINHFPGMEVLARKNLLAKGLMKMRKEYPEEYAFFPLTWLLPAEFSELQLYYEAQPGKVTYIAKPEASSQGKGIFLTRKLEDLDGYAGVVQTYVDKPFLIDGLKFDLRIYVLLAGCDPLRIYLYKEGLARFATQDYKKPKKNNLKDACMHLTNYAINKLNPKFIFNKDSKDMNVGHKRSLTAVYKSLESNGVDVESLKQKINGAIVKTIITGQPFLAYMYRLSQPLNYSNDMCFQILGFDILIDQNKDPILLEVNHTPSFTTDTPLDRLIKKNLIADTLDLMNVNLQNKNTKLSNIRQHHEKRAQRAHTRLTPQQKQAKRTQQQMNRDAYEGEHSKNFAKLYPVEDQSLAEKYWTMIRFMSKEFLEHVGIRKKHLVDHDSSLSHSMSPSKFKTANSTKSDRSQSPTKPRKEKELVILPRLAKFSKSQVIAERIVSRRAKNQIKMPIVSQSLDFLQEQIIESKKKQAEIETSMFGKYIVPKTFDYSKGEPQPTIAEEMQQFVEIKQQRHSSDRRPFKAKKRFAFDSFL